MCGFIAQLVEHRAGIAEVTGSNPVENIKVNSIGIGKKIVQQHNNRILKCLKHPLTHM